MPLRYRALATDYDGTIAAEGVVDERTVAALQRARDAGLRLILVTGRQIDDLSTVFPHAQLFHSIVAENGAVLFDPATDEVKTLAAPPPRGLIDALRLQHVPVSIGRSIVATDEPYADALKAAIRTHGLEWDVIYNKGSVMALPSGVTKATGLRAALEVWVVPAADTIAVGDAENDQVLLEMCGFAVAVANALPAVKQVADLVTEASNGAGVRELIDRILPAMPAST